MVSELECNKASASTQSMQGACVAEETLPQRRHGVGFRVYTESSSRNVSRLASKLAL